MEITLNTKLETAIEILAAKIATCYKQGYTVKDNEMKKLLNEREEKYTGNK